MKKDDEEKGIDFKTPTLEETIEKLAKNKWQYASAGDVKRLFDEVMRLRTHIVSLHLSSKK